MKIKVLNLEGGNIDRFKNGIRYEELDVLKTELLQYLDQDVTKKCWVIQKDSSIKTTVLYFDLDDTHELFEPAYDYILNYLSCYYDLDNLTGLIWKNKSEEKYHIYFVNIFVSKKSLEALVKSINKDYGKKLVDEACIHNFLKFEGFKKFKNGKFVDNSEYEVIMNENNEGLDMSDYYDAIYDFNKPETATKKPLPVVSPEKKLKAAKSKSKPAANVVADNDNDKLSQLCNTLLDTDCEWSVEARENENSFLVQHISSNFFDMLDQNF